MENPKTILLTGGGSGGPVTPLLALADHLRSRGYELAWIGTTTGIEKEMVGAKNIPFYPIASGKLRRYFSWQNVLDIVRIKVGFFQALSLLRKIKPSLIITAGGFVSVPVVWAGWLLRIPALVHQQDIRPGLANRLMAPFAKVVTVTFEKNLSDYGTKAIWTGNPIQQEFFSDAQGYIANNAKPRLLVMGGGTGAEAINELVRAAAPELIKACDIVHVIGKNSRLVAARKDGYAVYNFLMPQEMAKEMRDAALVVTRAGLGTLSELAYLGKPAVIIPMPHSHQEDNANYFKEHKAAIVLNQKELTPESFVGRVRALLGSEAELRNMGTVFKSVLKVPGNEAIVAVAEKITK